MSDDDFFIIGAKKKPQIHKDPDKNEQAECQESFKKAFLSESTTNKAKLLESCINGDIDKMMIRPTMWKLLLGVLPFDNSISEWIKIITKQRNEYKTKLKNINTLKKFAGDPLGGTNDSGWNSFFEDNELKKIINLDINRTYQDKDLFQNTIIKDILVNILFIWSKENRDTSYRQGMNEILAVLLFALYPFYFKIDSKLLKNQEALNSLNNNLLNLNLSNVASENQDKYKDIYNFIHDQDETAADLYYLFDAIMSKGVKDLFDTGNSNKKRDPVSYKKYELFQQQWTEGEEILNEVDQLPLHRRCHLIIKEKLKIIDEELYNHFIKIDLNCAIFLQRWLKCIFNREFHPRDVIVLWDTILANDIIDTTKSADSYNLIFIDFIAVAMINYIREDLLRKDQNECFQRLFKYPPIETPMILVKSAMQIKEILYNRRKKFLEKKKLTNIENPSNSNINTANKSSKNLQPPIDILGNNKNISGNGNSSNSKNNINLNKSSSENSNFNSANNPKQTISSTINSFASNSNNNLTNKNLKHGNSGSGNNSINQTKESNLTNNGNNNNNTNAIFLDEEDFRPQLIEKLENIFNKYEKHYEAGDKEDFQNIIETLKNNLIDD